MTLAGLKISELSLNLSRAKCSPMEIHRDFRLRIDSLERKINAYITISRHQAEDRSEELFRTFKSRQYLPPLFSIPGALKDNIITKGIETTCGSRVLEGYLPPYDSTPARKLNEAGYILMGKANMDEFSMGYTTETSAFGTTLNPYDTSRVAGGSSGGSAASVACGMSAFALGSDTGGSVRQPASFCNLVGFKPTYGRISRYGLVAFASSLDQVGIITKDVDDSITVYQSVGGFDPLDSTSIREDIRLDAGFQNRDTEMLKIGYFSQIRNADVNPDIMSVFDNAVKFFERKCRTVKSVSFPMMDSIPGCYFIIANSECSANLARYDGIRYGPGLEESRFGNLEDYHRTFRGRGFGEEVRRRILTGTFALCSGYYDRFYAKANRVRGLIIEEFEKIFQDVDILISPTCPSLPWKVGEYKNDPIALYYSDLFTIPANLTGYPSISVPGGFSKDGLPTGIMMTSRYKDEYSLFRAAKLFEKNNPFHQSTPGI